MSNTFSYQHYHELFVHLNLTHVVNFITHRLGNRLDLILTTMPSRFLGVSAEHDTFPFDHHLINFQLDFGTKRDKCLRYVFIITKNANWQALEASSA